MAVFLNTNKTRFQTGCGNDNGFTLVELMIVVAIIAIILTLALPVYNDYTVRAKVGEALSVTAAAKTIVASSCIEEPGIPDISVAPMGYDFTAPTEYVAAINLSGPCTQPAITAITQNTGATPDPSITLTGYMDNGRIEFICSTDGEFYHVPVDCRNVTP